MHRALSRKVDPSGTERGAQIGLLVTADVLARSRVFGESEESAERAALAMGKAVLNEANKTARSVETPWRVAYEKIKAWALANKNEFLSSETATMPPATRRGIGVWFDSHAESENRPVAAILVSVFDELAKDFGFRKGQVLGDLCEQGLLIPEGDNKKARKVGYNGGRASAYWIVLDSGDAQQ
jgi:hypothetical protein